jgi:hypothetical protein
MKGNSNCSLITQGNQLFSALQVAGLVALLSASPSSLFAETNLSRLSRLAAQGKFAGVFSINLSDQEKRKLLDDLKNKTGYKNIHFDKDNKLVIDATADFKGGSALARTLLHDAVNSTNIRFNLVSVRSEEIAFASVGKGIQFDMDARVNRATLYEMKIDFGDFNLFFASDDEAIKAYTVGLVLLHELAHKLYDVNDEPNGDADPGVLENRYLNPIRRELGLAERVHYVAKSVRSLQGHPHDVWRQLTFNLQGREKVLRWENDIVGGLTCFKTSSRTLKKSEPKSL